MRDSSRFPPLNALRAYEAAARHLSFKRAAKELFVTPGAISHQVKLLEEHLGVALFRRLTRALELTPEGHTLLPKVQEGLAALLEAVELVRVRGASRDVTVIAPPAFATRWLVPRLARFTVAHPEVQLHVASRAATIDPGEGDEIDIGSGEDSPELMIRFGRGRYKGVRVDKVFSAVYVPVCSPKLLRGKHALKTPADLRHHTLLHDDVVVEEGARPDWGDWLEMAGVAGVDAQRGPHFSDASLALDAASQGLGVALAMKPLVSIEIEAGRLVIPFDLPAKTVYAYYLISTGGDADNTAVEAFRSWLLEESLAERR
jgi:LysR family transcriptional regulator, glycine cleavage system transcriptional activator